MTTAAQTYPERDEPQRVWAIEPRLCCASGEQNVILDRARAWRRRVLAWIPRSKLH